MDTRVTDRQLEVLRWIAEGCRDGHWAEGDFYFKIAAGALQNRRLVEVHKRSRSWSATINDAGVYYLEHGDFPPGHEFSKLDLTPVARIYDSGPSDEGESTRSAPEPEFDIVSPVQERQRLGDPNPRTDDPWEERVLVSVKEAAWVLSMSENMIRDAAKSGDLHRVFIGRGTTNYRIVYRSLLAWVNDLPQDPNDRWKSW